MKASPLITPQLLDFTDLGLDFGRVRAVGCRQLPKLLLALLDLANRSSPAQAAFFPDPAQGSLLLDRKEEAGRANVVQMRRTGEHRKCGSHSHAAHTPLLAYARHAHSTHHLHAAHARHFAHALADEGVWRAGTRVRSIRTEDKRILISFGQR